MKRTDWITALAFLTASSALAQTDGPVGAGAISCREYLNAHASPAERDLYAQWASGLVVGRLSGEHHFIPEKLSVGEIATQLQSICAHDPKLTVLLASLNIARGYRDQAPK